MYYFFVIICRSVLIFDLFMIISLVTFSIDRGHRLASEEEKLEDRKNAQTKGTNTGPESSKYWWR